MLTDQGTHCLHYANASNGDARIESVFGAASGPYRRGTHPGPDATRALLTFENGVHAQWTTNGGAGRGRVRGELPAQARSPTPSAVTPPESSSASGGWRVAGPGGTDGGSFDGTAWREQNRRTRARFYEWMFEWAASGAPPGTDLECSLQGWTAVLALYASTLRNEPAGWTGSPSTTTSSTGSRRG